MAKTWQRKDEKLPPTTVTKTTTTSKKMSLTFNKDIGPRFTRCNWFEFAIF
jgi:hypothetical protein